MCTVNSIEKTAASYTSDDTPAKPLSVNLVLTHRCNYKCKFCFGKFESEEFFVYDRVLEIPCILKRLGTSKFTIEGGEPFLLPNLLEKLLKRAHECELTTMVISNGSLIRRDFLEGIVSYLDWLGLSIDSPEEETEKLLGRGFGNHVAKIKKIAEWTHELGILLKTNTVVTRYNLNDDLVSLLKELKPVRAKFFQYLSIRGINDEYASELQITEEEFKAFVKRHKILENYGISVVGETNHDMKGSYLMLFPDGRFFNNNDGTYFYTTHTIFENPELAFREARWDYEKFLRRSGKYDWERRKY